MCGKLWFRNVQVQWMLSRHTGGIRSDFFYLFYFSFFLKKKTKNKTELFWLAISASPSIVYKPVLADTKHITRNYMARLQVLFELPYSH